MVVLVTGAKGQLGQALQFVAPKHPEITFFFYDSEQLNIANIEQCTAVFNTLQPDFCINTAAYTAVDKAETETEKAQSVNTNGPLNLALVCKANHTVLVHVSTDFVFDGNALTPYVETAVPNPQSVYGQTKLAGEKAIQDTFDNYFIVRTAWVYSQFGANFMKTILRLAADRDTLTVVSDQMGTPTNAIDLAEVLVEIINKQAVNPNNTALFGMYHFSNEGQCSWFDFAQKIVEVNHLALKVLPIPTTDYPTPAQRPSYSVLDKTKIKTTFNLTIKSWEASLSTTVM